MEVTMRFAKLVPLPLLVAVVTGTPARAQDLSTSSSSGTMTITVYIPPIAPAIKAAQDGAIGLWTIDGRFDGMMLRVGDIGGDTPVTLYTRPGNLVALAAGGRSWTAQSIIQADAGTSDQGLIRSEFQAPLFKRADTITVIGL